MQAGDYRHYQHTYIKYNECGYKSESQKCTSPLMYERMNLSKINGYLQRRHHPLPLVSLLGHQAFAPLQVLPNFLLNLHHLLPVIAVSLVLGIHSVLLKNSAKPN